MTDEKPLRPAGDTMHGQHLREHPYARYMEQDPQGTVAQTWLDDMTEGKRRGNHDRTH
jgi:hypothetical protein